METKNLDELKGNEKNPRQISKHDFEALKKSIEEFGDISGIVFNTTTQQLVGGHQRIQAFKHLGKGAQVHIIERLTEPNEKGTVAIGYVTMGTERYAYREVQWDADRELAANIAANRISGEWDMDLLAEADYHLFTNNADLLALTGQTDEEISKLLDAVGANGEGDPAEDEAPEVDDVNPPVSKLGEIFQLGSHRLMCGDSTDFGAVSDLMNGQTADMVFTDPPYGVDYEGINNDDRAGLKNLLHEVFTNIAAVTKPGSAFYCFHSDKCADIFHDEYRQFCHFSSMLIWVKPSLVLSQSDYHSKHEPFMYGWLNGSNHSWYGDRQKTTVWEYGKENHEGHTTPKPTSLIVDAIKLSSLNNALVIDLFGGSGATLIAAEQTNRMCYMMELDPKYCDVIRKRYAKHINQELEWQNVTPVIQTSELPATANA